MWYTKHKMVHYSIEAIFVGLGTMVLGTLFSVMSMYAQKDFSIKQIDFWPSLIIVNFMVGFVFHLLCEWSGVNKWYCTSGYACSKK